MQSRMSTDKKARKFFFSYFFSKGEDNGFGHTIFEFGKIDETFIDEVIEFMKNNHDFEQVTILSFQELPVGEVG